MLAPALFFMFKLTYVVSRTGHPHHIPLAVSGKNGQAYGFAMWDPKVQAHVFRFTKEQWEGRADKEILKRSNRGAAIWMVRAEVELDEESPVGQLSQELDAVRSELEETKRKLEATQQEYEALSAASRPSEPASGDSAPGSDNRRVMSVEVTAIEEAAGQPPMGDSTGAPSQEPPSSKLKGLKFNELQEQARAANEQGAEIPLDTIKTKVGLTAALGDWLDSQPAASDPVTTEEMPNPPSTPAPAE